MSRGCRFLALEPDLSTVEILGDHDWDDARNRAEKGDLARELRAAVAETLRQQRLRVELPPETGPDVVRRGDVLVAVQVARLDRGLVTHRLSSARLTCRVSFLRGPRRVPADAFEITVETDPGSPATLVARLTAEFLPRFAERAELLLR